MNVLLMLSNVIGFLCLAAALLKALEIGPSVGPAFSQAARLLILLMVFLSVYSAIEALSWGGPARPAQSILTFILGAFSVWRAFSPAWAKFFTRPNWHTSTTPRA